MWNAAWEYSTDQVWCGVMSPGISSMRLSLSSHTVLPVLLLRLMNLNSSRLPSLSTGRCATHLDPGTGIISIARSGFQLPVCGESPADADCTVLLYGRCGYTYDDFPAVYVCLDSFLVFMRIEYS